MNKVPKVLAAGPHGGAVRCVVDALRRPDVPVRARVHMEHEIRS
jgi:hypothetical protein